MGNEVLTSLSPGKLTLAWSSECSGCGGETAVNLVKMMEGKTVIVTGANSGIGKATAAAMVALRSRVILACRDASTARPGLFGRLRNESSLVSLGFQR